MKMEKRIEEDQSKTTGIKAEVLKYP